MKSSDYETRKCKEDLYFSINSWLAAMSLKTNCKNEFSEPLIILIFWTNFEVRNLMFLLMTWREKCINIHINKGEGNQDKDRLLIQSNMDNLIYRCNKPLCDSVGDWCKLSGFMSKAKVPTTKYDGRFYPREWWLQTNEHNHGDSQL